MDLQVSTENKIKSKTRKTNIKKNNTNPKNINTKKKNINNKSINNKSINNKSINNKINTINMTDDTINKDKKNIIIENNNTNEKINQDKEINLKLKSKYTLWYHNSNNNNWNLDSYINICEFESVIDILKCNVTMQNFKQLITNGMFFIMKGDIKPTWEDTLNINGGCISWKINKVNVINIWINFVELFLCNSFDVFEEYDLNGISISPKKHNNILKLWLGKEISEDELKKIDLNEKCLFDDTCKMFKKHQDNINNDNSKNDKINNTNANIKDNKDNEDIEDK